MGLTHDACANVLTGKVSATIVASLCDELVTAASEEEEAFADFSNPGDFVNLGVAIICMCTAGIAAGLTMGVVSLDELDLRVKVRCGSVEERGYAARLLPLIRWQPRHQLLCTLLLLNSVANEALPLFLDALVPPWAAIVLSVTAVLFAGEIIPSAIFTGPAKLKIASRLSVGPAAPRLCAAGPIPTHVRSVAPIPTDFRPATRIPAPHASHRVG